MKPLTSNIIFLAITGLLVISVGSLTYTFSSKNDKANTSGTSTPTTKTYQKDTDDKYEDDDDSKSYTATQTPPPTNTTPTTQTPATTGAKTYTANDVSSHNNQSSCWTIVNGNVYDVTSYINSHPGGQGAIKSICGVDGSGAFGNQHGGASKPERVLQSFLIGSLK